MSASITGTWFICPTPFGAQGEVDHDSTRTLVDAVIAWGVDGLTLLGVMGEPGTLSDEKRAAVQETFMGRHVSRDGGAARSTI